MENKIYFENEITNKLFVAFISKYPESYHPYDIERFYDFSISSLLNNCRLNEASLIGALRGKGLTENVVGECAEFYYNKYLDIVEFYDYLKTRDLLK